MPNINHNAAQVGQVGILVFKPEVDVPPALQPKASGGVPALEQGSAAAYKMSIAMDEFQRKLKEPPTKAAPTVRQVLGPSEFIGDVDGEYFVFHEISTVGMVDGKKADLPSPLFVSGTRTYTNAFGAMVTSLSIRPLNAKEQKALDDAIAALPRSNLLEWTDSSGQHKITAELVELIDNVAHLKKEDGTIVKIPLSKLNSESRKLAQELLGT